MLKEGGYMRPQIMVFVGHLLGGLLILLGLWWLVENMAALPDYKLVVALAAVTGLVLSHFRWWRLGRKIHDDGICVKVNYLIVSNYLIMLLGIVLLDFKR
jgi:hypothetical protein